MKRRTISTAGTLAIALFSAGAGYALCGFLAYEVHVPNGWALFGMVPFSVAGLVCLAFDPRR